MLKKNERLGFMKKITKEVKNDVLYIEAVSDIISSVHFKKMDEFIMHGTTTCLEHCIDVSYMTYKICRRYGLDYKSAARAALLHDFFLYDWHRHFEETGDRFHGFTHPRKAMENAVKYFKISKKEQNMILRHMWPLTIIPPRTIEGMVLLYADKVCTVKEASAGIRNRLSDKFNKLCRVLYVTEN